MEKETEKLRESEPSFLITPENNIKDNLEKFNLKWGLNNNVLRSQLEFQSPETKPELVTFISMKKPGYDSFLLGEILIEINRRGFKPAPAPYLLGFLTQYPRETVRFYFDTAFLDEKNLLINSKGKQVWLTPHGIHYHGEDNLRIVCSAGNTMNPKNGFHNDWIFAVIKK